MLDLTKEWFAVVRTLRQQQQQQEAAAEGPASRFDAGTAVGRGYSSAAEALVGSRWRTPLTPFMQQVGGCVLICGANCSLVHGRKWRTSHILPNTAVVAHRAMFCTGTVQQLQQYCSKQRVVPQPSIYNLRPRATARVEAADSIPLSACMSSIVQLRRTAQKAAMLELLPVCRFQLL